MKRSEALILIANQLDFLNGKFEGMRDNFSKDELSKADVILTTLEQAGMQHIGYEEGYETGVVDPTGIKEYYTEYITGWEPEDV